MDQGFSWQSAEEQGIHQSAQNGSQFEHTVLETPAKFEERLDSLTARVEGGDSSQRGVTDVGTHQNQAKIDMTWTSHCRKD